MIFFFYFFFNWRLQMFGWLHGLQFQAIGTSALQLARCSTLPSSLPALPWERTQRKAGHQQLSKPRAGNRPHQEPTAPSCCPGTRAAAAKPRSPHSAEAGYQAKCPPCTAWKEISFNASKAYAGWRSLVLSVLPFPPLEYTVHRVYGAASA